MFAAVLLLLFFSFNIINVTVSVKRVTHISNKRDKFISFALPVVKYTCQCAGDRLSVCGVSSSTVVSFVSFFF